VVDCTAAVVVRALETAVWVEELELAVEEPDAEVADCFA